MMVQFSGWWFLLFIVLLMFIFIRFARFFLLILLAMIAWQIVTVALAKLVLLFKQIYDDYGKSRVQKKPSSGKQDPSFKKDDAEDAEFREDI